MKLNFKVLAFSLASIPLIIGGGCSEQTKKSLTVPSSSTTTILETPAADTIDVTSTIDTANTPSSTAPVPPATAPLLNRPISQWPRYEFKELNFSIQLPFNRDQIRYSFHDCLKSEDRCDGVGMYWYGGYAHTKKDSWDISLGSFSQNFSYGREGSITDISGLITGKNPQLLFPGMSTEHGIEIHPLQTVIVQNTPLYVFDTYKDFYKNTELDPFSEFGVAIKLPFHNKFKAAVMTFNPATVPYNFISKILKTIQFNKTDYFANEGSGWPRYTFKELGFSLQLPFPTSMVSSSEYRCDQHLDDTESGCSSDEKFKKYSGVFTTLNYNYEFLTAVSKDSLAYGISEPYLFITNGKYFLGDPSDEEPDFEMHPLAVIKTKNINAIVVNYTADLKKDIMESAKFGLLVSLKGKDYALATFKFNTDDITTITLKKIAETIRFQ